MRERGRGVVAGEKGEIRRCDTDPLFYIYAHTPPVLRGGGIPPPPPPPRPVLTPPAAREGGRGGRGHRSCKHIRFGAVMTNEREHAINPTR